MDLDYKIRSASTILFNILLLTFSITSNKIIRNHKIISKNSLRVCLIEGERREIEKKLCDPI